MTNKTNRLLVIVLALQGLILAGQWLGAPSVPVAQAQPDPNRDRWIMIDEMKSLNAKMDRLIGILEGGNLQVRAVSPDERNNGQRGR